MDRYVGLVDIMGDFDTLNVINHFSSLAKELSLLGHILLCH